MSTTSIRRLAMRGTVLLSVVLLATAALAGPPAAASAQFPAFIPMPPGITVSGVAVDKVGHVYVSIREPVGGVPFGKIWRFTPDGEQSLYAEVAKGEIYGLAVSANGVVYAAVGRVGPDRGVYRVDRDGQVERLPGSEQIVFANGLTFDHEGTLYVTESHSGTAPNYGQGGIWRIPREGQAELWVRSPLLTGVSVLGYPVGANGIAFDQDALYVTNSIPARILRIPVLPDGSPGEIELWTMLQDVPESPLAGAPLPVLADDVRLDVHGNLYVAVLTRAAVVRIDAVDKSQETVAAFQVVPHGSVPNAPLDASASVNFGTGKGERQNLFVTNLGVGKLFAPSLPWAGPALVKIHAGVPGRPLP